MAAPRDIVDALESVASIYFSDVRHKIGIIAKFGSCRSQGNAN